MEEMHWKWYGGSARNFCPHLPVCTKPETLWTLSCWVFMEASLHGLNWVNCWPMVSEFHLQLLSLLQRSWTESFNPFKLAPLATCPILWCFPKATSLITKTSLLLSVLKKFQTFWKPWARKMARNQIYMINMFSSSEW